MLTPCKKENRSTRVKLIGYWLFCFSSLSLFAFRLVPFGNKMQATHQISNLNYLIVSYIF